METSSLLRGVQVVSLAVNLPGPLAAARLTQLGAAVTKIVPPGGDPLAWVVPALHAALQAGQTVVTLDLKAPDDRGRLDGFLAKADLLLTATRPAALARLGLDWPSLTARHPQLCQVAIVGFPSPDEDRAGHDLTYQAIWGLVEPPLLPRLPLADYAAAADAVSMALALLLARERTGHGDYAAVALTGALEPYVDSLRHGLLASGSLLGGGSPFYNLYRTADGWLAVAAIEPHFSERLAAALKLTSPDRNVLAAVFLSRTAAEWEAWAIERDLPIAAVRAAPRSDRSGDRPKQEGGFHV